MNHIGQAYRNLITEDKRGKQAKQRSLETIRMHFNNGAWLDKVFEHEDNPERMTNIDYMFHHFEEAFFHEREMKDTAFVRIMPNICKVAFELGFQNSNPDQERLERLRVINNYAFSLFMKGDTQILDGFPSDYETLNDTFGKEIDAQAVSDDELRRNTDFGGHTDYDMIEIPDFETAKKYGEYSYSGGRLCYTQGERTWDQFTNNGTNKCFCLTKKGFKDVPEEHTEPRADLYEGFSTDAYDDYGLSMVWVFVGKNGVITNSNTRWNHNAKYGRYSVDNAFDKHGLSVLLGQDFDNILRSKGFKVIRFEDVHRLLDSGVDPKKVFDKIGDYQEGYAVVKFDGRYNHIDTEGNLVSPDQWWDCCYDFKDGYARVQLDWKYNHIDQTGHLISDQWWNWCEDFFEGRGKVKLNVQLNFIDQTGHLISDQWWDSCWDFINGYARVKLNGQLNFIDQTGHLISDQWWDWCWDFHEGYARVKLDGKYNHIDQNGRLISDQWWDSCWNFQDGYAKVKLNDNYYYIDTKGNLYDMNKQLIQRNPNPPRRPVHESMEWFRKLGIMTRKRIIMTESQLRRLVENCVDEVIKTIPAKPSSEANVAIPDEFTLGGGKDGIHIYKLANYFEDENGEPILVPLYINNGRKESPTEQWRIGKWYECGVGEHTVEVDDNTGEIIDYGKVTASIGDGLSFRPGFHSGEGAPYAPHIYDRKSNFNDEDIDGNISNGVPGAMKRKYQTLSDEEKRKFRNNFDYSRTRFQKKGTAWVEVVISYSQDESEKIGAKGLKGVPEYGYKFRTNTSANSDATWYISRYMKIIKVLSNEEVKAACASGNIIPLDTQKSQIMVLPSNGGKPQRSRRYMG